MRGWPWPAEEQHFLLPALHIPGSQVLLASRLWQGCAAGCPRASPSNSTGARSSPAGPWHGLSWLGRTLPAAGCEQRGTWGDVRLTDPQTERAPGRGVAGMCCSISAEGRGVMEQLKALMGTLQPGAGMILDCSAKSLWISTQRVSFCSTCWTLSICCAWICGSSKGHLPTSSGVESPEKSFGTFLLIPKLLWGITRLTRSQPC